MNEFELIRRYFSGQKSKSREVICGIGDDAAILELPVTHQLVVTVDTLVEHVHFSNATSPEDIGYKSLGVNLSDLAAMAAIPRWITLALTMPKVDELWLQKFSEGLFNLAETYNVELIGGDITQGPLTITIQALGLVPKGQAVTRSGAKPGDLIYVTNTLGEAGLALQHIQNKLKLPNHYESEILTRLHRPIPRVKEGLLLGNQASAMIDISDGLAADLGHILQQSGVGAVVYVEKIPCSKAILTSVPLEIAYNLALTSGDDYELCFTLPSSIHKHIEQMMIDQGCSITCIGNIQASPKFEFLLNNKPYHSPKKGYRHFDE